MNDREYGIGVSILRRTGYAVVEDGPAVIIITSGHATRYDTPQCAIDKLLSEHLTKVDPGEYIHLGSPGSPDLFGAMVVVREISVQGDIRVLYDFATPGGTTGYGSMHFDHARSVLRPKVRQV